MPRILKDGLRVEGQTMSEADRTFARRVAPGLVGVPFSAGGLLVGWRGMGKRENG